MSEPLTFPTFEIPEALREQGAADRLAGAMDAARERLAFPAGVEPMDLLDLALARFVSTTEPAVLEELAAEEVRAFNGTEDEPARTLSDDERRAILARHLAAVRTAADRLREADRELGAIPLAIEDNAGRPAALATLHASQAAGAAYSALDLCVSLLSAALEAPVPQRFLAVPVVTVRDLACERRSCT